MTKLILPDHVTIEISRVSRRRFKAVYTERFDRYKKGIDASVKILQESVIGTKKIALVEKIGDDTLRLTVVGTREEIGDAILGEFLMWSTMRHLTLGQMLSYSLAGLMAPGLIDKPTLVGALAFAAGLEPRGPLCQEEGKHERGWHVSRLLDTPEDYRTNPDTKTLYVVYCHHPDHGGAPHYCGDYSAAFPELYRQELHRKGMAFVKWWEANCTCEWKGPGGAFSKADPSCKIHGAEAERINKDLEV